MNAGIYGVPLGAAVFIGALAFVLHRYEWLPRVIAWLFGAVAALLVIAIPQWRDALASVASNGPGLVGLFIALFIGGVAFFAEAIRKHKHHPVLTPLVSGIFGTAVIVGLAMLGKLTGTAARAVPKTGAAMADAFTQIHNGHAAHALAGSGTAVVWAIAFTVVGALVYLGFRVERGRSGGARSRHAFANSRGLPSGR